MTWVEEERQKAIQSETNQADESAGQASGILGANIALSSSDHAIGHALLAVFHEMRAMRIMLAGTLGDVGVSLQSQAESAAEQASPRRNRGSW